MVHSTSGCTCGWQVKLCDLSLTRAIPERFCGESYSVKALYKCPVYFTYLPGHCPNQPVQAATVLFDEPDSSEQRKRD